jgi:leucyl aminopeptidase
MQLKTTKQSLDSQKKTYTRIRFIEKGSERLIDRDGVLELHIVVGKLEKLTPRTVRTLIREIVMSAKKHKLEKIALSLTDTHFPGLATYGTEWFWQTVGENITLANYEFTKYKSKAPKPSLTEILLTDLTDTVSEKALRRGEVIGNFANLSRDIANTPGGDMTPEGLGDAAKRILKGTKATVKVLDLKAIQKLGMGGLLGVGQGAVHTPRFIIMEYKNPGAKGDPIVFVGKGVTFDTGGLQVKPGMAMYEMHMDMSGGAAVIGAIGAIATLGIKTHVIGLIPAAENAISDTAVRPGDVLKMMSGTTVDVLHTDAEGRIILADALTYAKQYKPRLVVDIATLTGAALVAVGQHAHVVMTKERELEDRLRDLGEESGDYVFPLPLWDEYKQYIKGVHGDLANIPSGDSKYGGSINGGMFLSHFAKGMRWAHIDMAPRMTSVASDKLAKGATGEPVRLLIKIAERF